MTSPRFEYAGIALDIVAKPYEYRIASSVFINSASFSSSVRCTSGAQIIFDRRVGKAMKLRYEKLWKWIWQTNWYLLTYCAIKSARSTWPNAVFPERLHCGFLAHTEISKWLTRHYIVFDGIKSSALDPSMHSLMGVPVLRACPPCQENWTTLDWSAQSRWQLSSCWACC